MVMWTILAAILLVVGLTLVVIEVFTPGLGVVGGLGIVLTMSGGAVAYLELDGASRLVAVTVGLLGTTVVAWGFRRSGAAKALVLDSVNQGSACDPSLAELVGQVGHAMTPLRPAGSVRIKGRIIDVVTEGGYVEPDVEVRVLRVEGTRVVVEPVQIFSGQPSSP